MSRAIWRRVVVALRFSPFRAALAQNKMAIRKLDNRWGAVFNKGDAAAVVAMHIEDVHVLPAGALMAQGPDDIQKFWAAMPASGGV